ncbi:hypothetical protein BJ508DRAFT_312673 [Ascobolus immersus RN42]|uniref:Uncharacterized protein n=1 Tax=Ascobolus immersus RN42 TaxID=1160509 RepID=A0A3N4HRF7_ASCIM|nr:hypothetical protein BJ508DRAFT_312673 [Ascobolus immersus RN42]
MYSQNPELAGPDTRRKHSDCNGDYVQGRRVYSTWYVIEALFHYDYTREAFARMSLREDLAMEVRKQREREDVTSKDQQYIPIEPQFRARAEFGKYIPTSTTYSIIGIRYPNNPVVTNASMCLSIPEEPWDLQYDPDAKEASTRAILLSGMKKVDEVAYV